MSIQLYHHPYTRAANVVWMLEELGADYTLVPVDVPGGAQKSPEFLALNPMGKLPTVVDGDVVLTESAAIAMYLADRYSIGELAPATDDPARAAYLRWCLYAPSVIEPGCYAHTAGWDFKPGAAGWGDWDAMLITIETAIGEGPWLLGERFTMADVVFGGTLRFMMQFGMLDKRTVFQDYVGRLNARPAQLAAQARNDAVIRELGLG